MANSKYVSNGRRAGLWAVCCVIVFSVQFTGCPKSKSPIQRALGYLALTQARQDSVIPGHVDYTGNWPQAFHFQHVTGYRIPDVSPFVVAFVHHALANVTPDTAKSLLLNDEEVVTAAEMRVRAVECLNRFASEGGMGDSGTFGFWPYDIGPGTSGSPLDDILFDLLQGPILGGSRAPVNLPNFPPELAIPADADVTATVYAALLDNYLIDSGPAVPSDIGAIFSDNRDRNNAPLRVAPGWLPHNSGAFLTWFMTPDGAGHQFGNDVDLVVNTNVLFALARFGNTSTPGYAKAVALIDGAVAEGLHRTRWGEISLYYPDTYVFQYCVSRAYDEGPVPELGRAVSQLASEVLAEAHRGIGQTAFWNKGHPELDTAFAVVTLLNAGIDSPFIEGGIAFLERTQNPRTGAWSEAPFFIARADSGMVIEWESAPLTTSIALEALCKARLRHAQ